jgi:hypothetical protein
MSTLRRRDFQAALLLGGAGARTLFGSPPSIGDTLQSGVERHKIPAAAAMAASAERIIYAGAFGKRDAAPTTPLTADAVPTSPR